MSFTYKIKTSKNLTEVFLGKHYLNTCSTLHYIADDNDSTSATCGNITLCFPETNSHDIKFWVTNQIKLGATVTTTYNIRIIY